MCLMSFKIPPKLSVAFFCEFSFSFIFGCVGSLPPQCLGFSVWWLLWMLSVGSRVLASVSVILRCAGKAGNPFQTTQGNRLSCRDQEGRRGSDRVGCHFLLQCMKMKSESKVAQSCLTLCDPMDCSLPGSFIHRIFQARVLEWVAVSFSNA